MKICVFGAGAIGDFPAFPYEFVIGKFFAKQRFEALAAPYAGLKDGVKGERIKHGQPSTNWPKRRYFW